MFEVCARRGGQKKGGENSPISPPLDPRLDVQVNEKVPEEHDERFATSMNFLSLFTVYVKFLS